MDAYSSGGEELAHSLRSSWASDSRLTDFKVWFAEFKRDIGAYAVFHSPARFAVNPLERFFKNWINRHGEESGTKAKWPRSLAATLGISDLKFQIQQKLNTGNRSLTSELSSHATERVRSGPVSPKRNPGTGSLLERR